MILLAFGILLGVVIVKVRNKIRDLELVNKKQAEEIAQLSQKHHTGS